MRTLAAVRLVVAAIAVVVAGTVTASPVQAAAPAPTITYLQVQPDQTTLRLSWAHVGGAIDSYEIWYRPSGTTTWTWSGASSVGSDYGSWVPYESGRTTYTRDFRATGITAGQSYDVAVRTIPLSGSSSDREATATTIVTNPPLGSVTTSATTAGKITVSWPAYAATPFLHYEVTLEEPNGATRTALVTNQSATARAFTGLVPGRRYKASVRVVQRQVVSGGQVVTSVRTAQSSVGRRVPSNEFFYATAPDAFLKTSDDSVFVVNGVNIKRAAHRKSTGEWETPYVKEEITALGQTGAPAFNTVRIAMDWAYYQNTTTGSVQIDTAAFAQLDQLIDEAAAQGLYVILDPIHISNPSSGMCTEDPVMNGAKRNIPAWAWSAVGLTPGTSCTIPTGDASWDNATDDVLALQQTADYLRYVAERYDGSTARGKQVIAIDLANEPAADGGTAKDKMDRLAAVYADWVAPTGTKSVRAQNLDKPLVVEAAFGNVSLAGVDLSSVAQPNVILSFHDYFGRSLSTSAVHGIGYSGSGYASQKEDTDRVDNDVLGSYVPYDSATLSYAARKAQHVTYLQQMRDWAAAAGMPLYIGEYGIRNPCGTGGGVFAHTKQYYVDTYGVYEDASVSRTAWTHGYWDQMALWWRGPTCTIPGQPSLANKQYFSYAKELTGGAVR